MLQSLIAGMPFSAILQKYRTISFSERDKGSRFEALIQRYLQTDPLYANRFSKVWLWNEFPFRRDFGGKDTGIDLVAKTNEGDFWAIQCKCYAENAHLGKDAVDSFLSTSSKQFQNDELKTTGFSVRLWVSTTNDFGSEFENTIRNQNPPVLKLGLHDLESAPVDWDSLEKGNSGKCSRNKVKSIRPHQKVAIDATHKYFEKSENSRGKLIMACGTGKTFTALKIAENETDGNGLVLCLVPSIALVGQMLREWSADATGTLNAICVCSDSEVSKKKSKDADEIFETVEDLALPASTNVEIVAAQILKYAGAHAETRKNLTVIFSTYHSIEVISKAQKKLENAYNSATAFSFDLIICDEAHRTTGVTLANDSESAFVCVHNNDFLSAKRRLYMTATPRLYGDESKKKAKESDAVLCSMDDPALYGEEIYRIGFGEAVENGLLADYKVLVLTIGEEQISESLQNAIADGSSEINTDDAAKFIGCINALSKRMLVNKELLLETDPEPMRRAVAFCQNIKNSKKTASVFNDSQDLYKKDIPNEKLREFVQIEAEHVDGTMGAGKRDAKLAWLKEETSSSPRKTCRILTNVRCLSEGVDVPALDAVLFLSAKNSQIDVVQSVGRVMRVSPGKKYGYIIIPIVVPVEMSPEDALNKNDRFSVVWSVLNALRAHDDRFNATINKIEFNKSKPKQILVGGIAGMNDGDSVFAENDGSTIQNTLNLQFEKLSGEIYVKMVEKVGDRRYWENWAKDVGEIALRHIDRIKKLISVSWKHKEAFDEFVSELQQNINPSVKENDVVEMLAQHIITRPVFDALFENHEFTKRNAISKSMSKMLSLLEEQSLDKDNETLQRFYESVRKRVSGIDNPEAKQKIIVELYDKFFKTAFPKVVEKLGIVYTPVEIVDFLVNSVESVLNKEFGRSLADDNIHILDPFTGTGTFITRLIQSGIIPKEKLPQKYHNEIHANEIVLLAYYIACVNIENAFAEATGTKSYEPFQGACLTDTFQLAEPGNENSLFKMFPENSDRVCAQKRLPLRVILGNPPYSVGQKSANDNAQNESYPALEKRIAETYATNTSATSSKSLYDSYIQAFRWASDRIDPAQGGIVAFVTNGAWLDGNAMDGFRRCLEKEFSAIYVFNLRGNCRTSGELRQREGAGIFGLGSRTPIALTVLVKKAAPTQTTPPQSLARIHYRDIGDYLSREDKLKIIKSAKDISFADGNKWEILSPNAHGDWINLRNNKFETYIPLEPEKKFYIKSKSVFVTQSLGVVTNQDSFAYNFSQEFEKKNSQVNIDFYNEARKDFAEKREKNREGRFEDLIKRDNSKISWYAKLQNKCERNEEAVFSEKFLRKSAYRPFQKQWHYFNPKWTNRPGQMSELFPTPKHKNLVICVSGVGVTKEFSSIITNIIPDLEIIGKSQCFPLYYYEKNRFQERDFFDDTRDSYVRRDGISDFILARSRELYGKKVTKEDIFYYVYGFLHSPDYRSEFSSDLKKSLPRLPLIEIPKDFWAFSKAGRELAELHLNYETLPLPRDILATTYGSEISNYRVEKMRFEKGKKAKDCPNKILYNEQITVGPVPAEAYEYIVNGKSAIEWIMERYAITTHPESGIVNDPNLWCAEHNDPAYIVNLLRRVIYLSGESVRIIKSLPKLTF